ncbi:MAG: bifunctional glutamate N-acetyltransferase/amino-acid acetyltransferase ArgJ [Acidimicrobiia bacterium]|nr:bifunctional glutamate N-acetyltransferase/amino-acid acetyltransferase ArgJ [Acidimicrobiia bacterium]
MSVTAPRGFRAAGVAAGIKSSGDLDVSLVAGDDELTAAAVFTTNRAAAAPVVVSRAQLDRGRPIRAVVLNSGCANAATGDSGLADAWAMVNAAASALGCSHEEVLVCSTGGIGQALPIKQVIEGVLEAGTRLGSSAEDGTRAALAIMTTDTVSKESTFSGAGFSVGGMAKGAGMVRPDMATMLVVLTTDAAADSATLTRALRTAVDQSFHALNIDGCPSTNDTVILLASGQSGVAPTAEALSEAVLAVSWDLANQLAADAEGASRVVTIEVVGAESDAIARSAGRLVADSTLVKSAFYGGDPNWGRLLGALGATDLDFDPMAFGVAYEGIDIARNGTAVDHDADALHEAIATGDFTVTMTIGDGPGRARVITTDLTPDYVTFNAEYS